MQWLNHSMGWDSLKSNMRQGHLTAQCMIMDCIAVTTQLTLIQSVIMDHMLLELGAHKVINIMLQ